MAAKWTLTILASWCIALASDAQSILDRAVQVDAEKVRLSEALTTVAREGKFKLSYNAASVRGDSIVSISLKGTVKEALRALVGGGYELKETGDHIILLGANGRKQKFMLRGSVYNATVGGPISQAFVHVVDEKHATTTDALGTFELEASGVRERTAVLVMRNEYHDTVVYVGRDGAVGRIPLRKRSVVTTVEPICLYDRCGVEDLGVARLLVPDRQLDRSADLDFEERSDWQISLIPNFGTNGKISGVVVNSVSLNILAGYSRGLEGFELGIGANLESRDVKGVQIAGITNLVGRNTEGVQVAGGINHTMRSLEGMQLAGLGNTVWDTLVGVQIAGGVNVVKGGLKGAQIAGAVNVATMDIDGTQIAGGVNVTPRDVRKTQIAGAVNVGHKVSGAQIAGGVNVALDSVGGGQVGFGANYAKSVTGGQVSFGANVVPGNVSGGQVGFGLNYAGMVTGGQFSFGANVVPGRVEAGQVGFGLNYATDIKGGQFSFGLNVVGDSAQGGQVGTLNFARHCTGWQVGVVNLSGSITGTPVGVLSVSLKGYHRFDVSTNDVMPLSLMVRTGVRSFHNILGFSPSVTPDERWGFLYGFGFEPSIGSSGFLNIDLTAEQVVEQRVWVDAVNIVGRLNVSYGRTLVGPLSLSVGPSINVLFTDWRDPETGMYLSTLVPSDPLFEEVQGTTRMSGWLGWKASVGLRF
jgi:hypothetical protein